MTCYFGSFLWGLFVLFSLMGWGGIINRFLFPEERVAAGQRAAWGICFSVFVGGILNLTWSISKAVVLAYLGIGMLYSTLSLFKSRKLSIKVILNLEKLRKDQFLVFGVCLILGLIAVQYAASVSPTGFNGHDDYYAYFVFPNKMLQTGSMGIDPFSGRRLITSLGGQSFLQTFILCILDEGNLHIIDSGIGLIVFVALVLCYFKEWHVSGRRGFCLLLLFLIVPYPIVNISSCMIPVTLLLSLFIILYWNKPSSKHVTGNAFIIALHISAICSLKSNLIPICVVLFMCSYFCYIFNSKSNRRSAVYELSVASIFVLIMLVPWMVSMYQSSGTLLYPLLGKGYHGAAYGSYLLPYSELTIKKGIGIVASTMTNGYLIAVLLLGWIAVKLQPRKGVSRGASISFLVSCVLGALAMEMAVGGFGGGRYSFPFVFAGTVIFMIMAFAIPGVVYKEKRHYPISLVFGIFVGGIILGSYCIDGNASFKRYQEFAWQIKIGLSGAHLCSKDEIAQYKRIQRSIPKSEVILARLEKPFLLDFRRNSVLIVDLPGGASPPPGMPAFKGSESLSEYLTSRGIRYVAYSYLNEANFSKSRTKYLKRLESPYPFARTDAEHTFDFQDNLMELGNTRKRIYDDGTHFVIDLMPFRGGHEYHS